jgi:hypothetical protein
MHGDRFTVRDMAAPSPRLRVQAMARLNEVHRSAHEEIDGEPMDGETCSTLPHSFVRRMRKVIRR